MASGDTILAPFPLYMNDFQRDTFHLSLTEQMIYLRALTYVWENGFIPADPRKFAALTVANELRKWREPVANVQRMMHERGDGSGTLTQKRVDEERQKYLQNREKQRKKKQAQREMSPGTPLGTPIGPITSTSTSTSIKDPPGGDPRGAISKKDFFNKGREVIGPDAGGLLTNLLKSCSGDLREALAVVLNAADTDDPFDFVYRATQKNKENDPFADYELTEEQHLERMAEYARKRGLMQ